MFPSFHICGCEAKVSLRTESSLEDGEMMASQRAGTRCNRMKCGDIAKEGMGLCHRMAAEYQGQTRCREGPEVFCQLLESYSAHFVGIV